MMNRDEILGRLKVTSLNVISLRSDERMDYVFKTNCLLKTDLLFVQEANLSQERVSVLNEKLNNPTFVMDNIDLDYDTGLIWFRSNNSFIQNVEVTFRNKHCFIAKIFTCFNFNVHIVNVHAPNNKKLRREFFINLSSKLIELNITPDLILGDFNVTTALRDRHRPDCSSRLAHDPGYGDMLRFQRDWGLTDLGEELNNVSHTFTHSTYQSTARIDRVYRTSTTQLKPSDIHTLDLSNEDFKFDHKSLSITLELYARESSSRRFMTDRPQDKSWRCNPKAITENKGLHTHLRNSLKLKGEEHTRSTLSSLENWHIVQAWLREELMHTGRKRASNLIRKVRSLASQQEKWETRLRCPTLPDEKRAHAQTRISHIRSELSIYLSQVTRAMLKKHRLLWLLKGEQGTHFYFSKVKPPRKPTIIPALNNGTSIVTNKAEICESACRFYEQLYTAEHTDSEVRSSIVEALRTSPFTKKLTSGDQSLLVQTISLEEIRLATRQMKNRKAPGPDGLPVEVFKLLPELAEYWLTPLFNDILKGRVILSKEDLESTITLIFKKGDPNLLKNYRPISLLNVFYKIFSKVISNRLKTILSKCIGDHQHAFLKGRLITDSVAEVLLIEEVAKAKELDDGVICFLDQEKAYDRVDHPYLTALMRVLKFPNCFIRMLRHLMRNVTTRVRVNGDFSRSFSMQRGVRQGDSLSCYLYLIAMEGLHAYLQADERLKGLSLTSNQTHFCKMYVDDTNVILKEVSMIPALVDRLTTYGNGTQAKVNLEKSQLLALGKHTRRPQSHLPWLRPGEIVKNLGCPMGEHISINEFWDSMESKLVLTLQNLRTRGHSLRGKVLCVNTFVSSKIWYYVQFLPIELKRLDKWQQLIQNFLFDGKGHWASADILTRPKKQGGYGLVNLRVEVNALLLRWITRYYTNPQAPWAYLLRELASLKLKNRKNDDTSPTTDPWLQCHTSADQSGAWPSIWGKIRRLWVATVRPHTTILLSNQRYALELPLTYLPELSCSANVRLKKDITIASRKSNSSLLQDVRRQLSPTQQDSLIRALRGKVMEVENADLFNIPPSAHNLPRPDWGTSLTVRFRTNNGTLYKPVVSFSIRKWRQWLTQNLLPTRLAPSETRTWRILWNLKLPEFIRQRAWRILNNRMPRQINDINTCPCERGSLTIAHVFNVCDVFNDSSNAIQRTFSDLTSQVNKGDLVTSLRDVLPKARQRNLGDKRWCTAVLTLHQSLWIAICNNRHQGTEFSVREVLNIFYHYIETKISLRDTLFWNNFLLCLARVYPLPFVADRKNTNQTPVVRSLVGVE
jgi:hypothetical protein